MFFAAYLTALLIASGTAEAQDVGLTSSRHAAYLEIGGSTSVYSLNYEFQALRNVAFRGGVFSTPVGYREASMHGGLVGASYLLGSGRHRLELGGALVGAFVSDRAGNGAFHSAPREKGFGLSASPIIGYRFQPTNSGLMLRLAFTPVFPVSGLKFSQSPLKGGLSIGWKF